MAAESSAQQPITSAVDPDLGVVKRFIQDKVAQGAIAVLLTSILALLMRMRDLNTELRMQMSAARRRRPPSETMRRLQMELPFWGTAAANDAKPDDAPPKQRGKKRGPRKPHAHGRPQLPADLPRIPDPHYVATEDRVCPRCDVGAERVTFRTAQKLDIEPARFVVREEQVEVIACQCCHEYIVCAPRPESIVPRGILGDELIVQATVDHYQDGVPWERMQTRAREQGVPLSANTLAQTSGRAIDLLDPIVRHILHKALTSTYLGFDATGIRVLDSEHPLGIRSGALWLLQGEHCYSYFMYATSGHAHHLETMLKGYNLASVMCDGAATNNCAEAAGGKCGGCNAHARRKLVEAVRGNDARALEGLELFAQIFHVDAESKRAGETIEQRFARRQCVSASNCRRTTRLGGCAPARRGAEVRAWTRGAVHSSRVAEAHRISA
jgi:transposase